MSQILWANNANTTLAGNVSNVATTATLTPGAGALFPSPGAGQYFVATFVDAATGLLNEIVHVTDVTGDVVTMVRAQEGTTALNWLAGDLFSNLVTAGTLQAFAQTGGTGVRTLASGNINVYVSTAGSDSTGDGTSGNPWATIQHAYNTIQQTYDLGGQYSATINLALAGTYNGGLNAVGPIVGQTSAVAIVGSTGAPTTFVINNSSGSAIVAANGAILSVSGVRISASSSGLVASSQGSSITFASVDFAACGFAQIFANEGTIASAGNYSISNGGGGVHMFAQFGGTISISGETVTLTGTPAFTTFAQAERCATIYAPSNTYSGAATGARYNVEMNAVIETGTAGANPNYFPGNSAGATVAGGQYY